MALSVSRRRAGLLAAAAALAGASRSNAAQSSANTIRFVPQVDLRIVDPVWSPAFVVRNFGYLVFDTLFALDATPDSPAADGGRLAHQPGPA